MQQKVSTIDIINDYSAKTKHKWRRVQRLPNPSNKLREYKVWVYTDDFENALGITEERVHYLIVKKRWQEQYDWCDHMTTRYGKMGIAIPLPIYEFVMTRKNLINELVVCIISDVNRWKYPDLQPYYYYKITLEDMHNFAKKQYTIFINQWREEVIGFPFALFKRV